MPKKDKKNAGGKGKRAPGKPVKKKRRRLTKRERILILSGAFAALLLAVIVFLHGYFRVRTVRVEGNTRYTDEEIREMVLTGGWKDNTLAYRLMYGAKGITDLPFIERVDVDVLSHDTVRLIVYEKALAGYIEYLGQYMYFDREGIVVESGKERLEGVPQVMGLRFGYVVLYDRLPVENENVFGLILSITQLLDKYHLSADRIFFDAGYRIFLYFDDIEAELGTSEYIDEKIEQLVHILPELEGRRGILRMKDYTPATRGITFEERK